MTHEFSLNKNEVEHKAVKVLRQHLMEIQEMTSRGVIAHQCKLFHDQLVPLQDLQNRGISVRLTNGKHAFADFCTHRDGMLGCAHNGNEETIEKFVRHNDGSVHRMPFERSIVGTSRQHLCDAAHALQFYGPQFFPQKDVSALCSEIRELGEKIANLDFDINLASSHQRQNLVENYEQKHAKIVERLFEIATDLEQKIQQAIADLDTIPA